MTGSIVGLGAVIVTGNITAKGVMMRTDATYALLAGGQLNLP